MARYPEFKKLSLRSAEIRDYLAKQPLAPKDPELAREQTDKTGRVGRRRRGAGSDTA